MSAEATWSYLGGDAIAAVELFRCLKAAGARVEIAAGGPSPGAIPVVAWGGEVVPAWGHLQRVLANCDGKVVVFGDPEGPMGAALGSLARVVLVSRNAGASGLQAALERSREALGNDAAADRIGIAAIRKPTERGELLRSLAGGRAAELLERQLGLARPAPRPEPVLTVAPPPAAPPQVGAVFAGAAGHDDLPVFGSRLSDLQQLLGREDCDANDVERLVASEPGLFAALITASNSAYYRSPRPIASLREAIVRLGVRQSLAVLLERMLRDSFVVPDPRAAAVLASVWQSAGLTARLSRRLAEWYGGVSPDDAYLGGLLHNIGELTMLWRVLRAGGDPVRILTEVSPRIAVRHEAIGAEVVQDWGLPPAVVRVVRGHHEPQRGASTAEVRMRVAVLAGWEEARTQLGDYLPTLHPLAIPSPFEELPENARARLRAEGETND